jgi:hypothetical protein
MQGGTNQAVTYRAFDTGTNEFFIHHSSYSFTHGRKLKSGHGHQSLATNSLGYRR